MNRDTQLDMDSFRKVLSQVSSQTGSKKRLKGDSLKVRTSVVINRESWTVLKHIAEHERTTASSILDLFLELGLTLYANDELEGLLDTRRKESTSPAYDVILDAGVPVETLALLVERLNLDQLLTLR